MKAGGPGAPLSQGQTRLSLLEDHCPQPSPSVLSPCNNGSSRKWLNPMYFYTQHTPGRVRYSLFLCMRGWGQGEVHMGEGVKHKESGPSSQLTHRKQPVPIAGRSHWAPFLPRCKITGKHLKTTALPNSGARGGCLLCGLPLQPFQVPVPLGMLGTKPIPSHTS